MAEERLLSGWGNHPVHRTRLAQPRDLGMLRTALDGGGLIARGNGRAYGDSAVGIDTTLQMRRFDKLLAFDPAHGELTAEAGVTLAEIITAFVPRGWFPYVTPGTKFVTLGGAIAVDAHGKNHHREGGFGRYVQRFDLLGPDGIIRSCSVQENAELFHRTIGGMGLTGIILRATIRLRPITTAAIRQETIPTPHLDATMAAFERSADATYSVAWIDTLASGAALGRSILMLGEHATPDELPQQWRATPLAMPPARTLSVPFTPPVSLIGTPVVRAFNWAYYHRMRAAPRHRITSLDSYFYPLDAILGWNRIYGRRGFFQFQCVLPLETARTGLVTLLSTIAGRRAGSFLAVLKRLGPQPGHFSFPMEGYTLALDFPVNPRTDSLAHELEAIAADHGGRLYLAKDAKMTAESLARLDPRGTDYARWRQEAGVAGCFRSRQSERLAL